MFRGKALNKNRLVHSMYEWVTEADKRAPTQARHCPLRKTLMQNATREILGLDYEMTGRNRYPISPSAIRWLSHGRPFDIHNHRLKVPWHWKMAACLSARCSIPRFCKLGVLRGCWLWFEAWTAAWGTSVCVWGRHTIPTARLSFCTFLSALISFVRYRRRGFCRSNKLYYYCVSQINEQRSNAFLGVGPEIKTPAFSDELVVCRWRRKGADI